MKKTIEGTELINLLRNHLVKNVVVNFSYQIGNFIGMNGIGNIYEYATDINGDVYGVCLQCKGQLTSISGLLEFKNFKTISLATDSEIRSLWNDKSTLIESQRANAAIYELAKKEETDVIFNKKINAEKEIYEILHSGEYGGLVTEEEWKDESKAKFSFCNVNNKILRIPCINQKMSIAFHTIKDRDDFIAKNLKLVNEYLMISE